jgi:nucleoid-associated protein YgaU
MEQLQKAILVASYSDGSSVAFNVQFNPTDLSFEKAAQIAEIPIPGLDSPLLQFVRGQNERLTVDLFFDTTEGGTGPGATSVTTLTDPVYSLIKIEPAGHAPPICTFMWNSHFPGADILPAAGNQRRNQFQCVVDSIRQKFTLFAPDGTPLRATLSLTLREYKTLDDQLAQLNLSSPDRSHSYVTQSRDTLASVSNQFYNDPTQWRYVAGANAIEDPRRLSSGISLSVPPIQ